MHTIMIKLNYLRPILKYHMGRSTFFLLILICLGGCDSRKEIRVEVQKILLKTPSGEYQFDAEDVGENIYISTPSLTIRVRTPKLNVFISPTSQPANFQVSPENKEVSVQFDSNGAFYQRDGKEKIPFQGTQIELRLSNDDWIGSKWLVDLPPPITKVSLSSSYVSSYRIEAKEAIEDLKGETQRFFVPFHIDGERYSLDASIEYNIDRSWHLRSFSFGGLP